MFIQENALGPISCKMVAILSRPQWVNLTMKKFAPCYHQGITVWVYCYIIQINLTDVAMSIPEVVS